MASHRPPHRRLAATSLVVIATLTGCIADSDGIDVPEATPAPATAADTADTDASDVAAPPASGPASTDGTGAADTRPPDTRPPDTAPPGTPVPDTGPDVNGAPATEPTTTDAPVADPFLRIGDGGEEVSIMQLKLRTLGYLDPGYADGRFDRATADALIDFQAQYGLVVDGIFGPETDRSLSAAAASVNPEN